MIYYRRADEPMRYKRYQSGAMQFIYHVDASGAPDGDGGGDHGDGNHRQGRGG